MGGGKFQTLTKKDFQSKPNAAILERIKKLNIDPLELMKVGGWVDGNTPIRNLCAASYVSMSIDLQKSIGVKLFNAGATSLAASMLIKHFNKQESK
jgi:hypothetical protein